MFDEEEEGEQSDASGGHMSGRKIAGDAERHLLEDFAALGVRMTRFVYI